MPDRGVSTRFAIFGASGERDDVVRDGGSARREGVRGREERTLMVEEGELALNESEISLG